MLQLSLKEQRNQRVADFSTKTKNSLRIVQTKQQIRVRRRTNTVKQRIKTFQNYAQKKQDI